MSNKHDVEGNLKDQKILLGLVRTPDGKIAISFCEAEPLSEIVRYFGIIVAECPFLFQHLKAQAAAKDRSGIITPEG